MQKEILDPCCGGRMFYFDKNDQHTLFCDIRQEFGIFCDGRKFNVEPNILSDFRCLPFPNESFSLVVFDPPHLTRCGVNSWMRKKYGQLPHFGKWQNYLQSGFIECWRVLKTHGTLIFKWNEHSIKRGQVLRLFLPITPLLGNRGTNEKTHWYVFFKNGVNA